jgi:hypothetical protein
MKSGPQVFLHQHGTENHLTQSIQQRGEEKNEDMFYLNSFTMNHRPKVKYAKSSITNQVIFPDELQYRGDEFNVDRERLGLFPSESVKDILKNSYVQIVPEGTKKYYFAQSTPHLIYE